MNPIVHDRARRMERTLPGRPSSQPSLRRSALQDVEILESRLAAGSVLLLPGITALFPFGLLGTDSIQARRTTPDAASWQTWDFPVRGSALDVALLPASRSASVDTAGASSSGLSPAAVDFLAARQQATTPESGFFSASSSPLPTPLARPAAPNTPLAGGTAGIVPSATDLVSQTAVSAAPAPPAATPFAPAADSARAPAPRAGTTAASAAATASAAPSTSRDSGLNTLATASNGGVPVQYVVTPARGLFVHDEGGPWTRVGGDGSILSVSAVTDASGQAAAFVMTADHALYRFSEASGWRQIGGSGTIRSVSAGTNTAGQATAYVLTGGGAFTYFSDATGWPVSAPGAPGTVLAVAAGANGRVAVITADHSVDEYNLASGWIQRTGAGFAQSISVPSQGSLVVYAVTQDNGLYRHVDGVGWQKFGDPGTIAAASAGTDAAGQAQAFVLTARSEPYELTGGGAWVRLGDAGTVQLARAADQGRGILVGSDGSVLQYRDQSGWARLTGSGFAEGSVSPTLLVSVPDFSTDQNVTAQVLASGVGAAAGLQAVVDVDRNNDGNFTDPGESRVATASIHGGTNTVSLGTLAPGSYTTRVVVNDSAGNQVTNQSASVSVDPYAGFIGSQDLQTLSNAYQAIAHTAARSPSSADRAPVVSIPDSFFVPFRQRHLFFDAQQRVGLNIRATLDKYVPALRSELEALGMKVLSEDDARGVIQGNLPLAAIAQLPAQAHFAAATPVYTGAGEVGAVTTQGDHVINADAYRTGQPADGTGVSVGVISDSVSQFQGGLADSQRTGDLPANVRVLADGPAGSSDEGRAMLEIVHDVAPGASLMFHTFFDSTGDVSSQSAAAAIQSLVSAGANVISDDLIALPDEPMFNDGILSQAVQQALAKGVFYTTSAGNRGGKGFIADWKSTTATVGGTKGTFFDLGGGDVLQNFTLAPGDFIDMSFEWDAAYLEGGSNQPNFKVPNNLDVDVTTADGSKILASFNSVNQNTGEAFEEVFFFNDGSFGTSNFAFAFPLVSGPAPTMIRWAARTESADPQAQGENGPTVFGHKAVAGAAATAAVDYRTPTTTEPYSSVGGNLPILFDVNGNRLSSPDIRAKPDITAPDNVDTTFFFPGEDVEPDGFPNFAGTSAATPHTAGAAALILSAYPGTSPTAVLQLLQQTAKDIMGTGFDFNSGAGLIQLTPGVAPPGGGTTSQLPDDGLEPNETSDKPTQVGTLSGSQTLSGLTINVHPDTGLPDYDWFRLTPAAAGTFTATIKITPEHGDLELHLFTVDPFGMLVELANSTNTGVTTHTVTAAAQAGQVLLVEVKGHESAPGVFGTGTYDLTLG